MSPRAALAPVVALATLLLAPPLRAQLPRSAACPDAQPLADPSLYCIDLIPTPDLDRAAGAVHLLPAATPFDVAVTPDGHLQFDAEVCVAGLPPASAFGAAAYVAWVTNARLSPVQRLGVLRDGCVRTGRIALDVFTVLVSAERRADARERTGRLVLRGRSASYLMHPHDGSRMAVPLNMGGAGGGHAHGDAAWPMPPMHPAAPWMITGLDGLAPSAGTWRAETGVDVAALPRVRPQETWPVADGDTVRLPVTAVRDTLAGQDVVRWAYAGQVPGPILRATRGATVHVVVRNALPMPTTVHWHGLRLDPASDGVPGHPFPPIAPGDSFTYTLRLPDAGTFWYHPHVREDVAQDLGLAGLLVVGERGERPAPQERTLVLDDLLADARGTFPYGDSAATQALMGRFGNRFLANGHERARLAVRAGQPIRLHLLNAASARPFNLGIAGAALELLGLDHGPVARPEVVANVVLGPAERATVDVRLPRAGRYALVNHVSAINHPAAAFADEVDTLAILDAAGPGLRAAGPAREDVAVAASIAAALAEAPAAPDHELVLTNRVDGLPFALEQLLRLDTSYVHPVEWTSTMAMMDVLSTAREAHWILRDETTGAEDMAIDWRVASGRPLRLRIRNDRHVLHAMAHPIHLHGTRFLVVAKNGEAVRPAGWKDTVLVPVGGSVELLVDTANAGTWMLHCHVAEHLESGMHAMVRVGG